MVHLHEGRIQYIRITLSGCIALARVSNRVYECIHWLLIHVRATCFTHLNTCNISIHVYMYWDVAGVQNIIKIVICSDVRYFFFMENMKGAEAPELRQNFHKGDEPSSVHSTTPLHPLFVKKTVGHVDMVNLNWLWSQWSVMWPMTSLSQKITFYIYISWFVSRL